MKRVSSPYGEELDSALCFGEPAVEGRSLYLSFWEGTDKGNSGEHRVIGGGMGAKVVWRESGRPARRRDLCRSQSCHSSEEVP